MLVCIQRVASSVVKWWSIEQEVRGSIPGLECVLVILFTQEVFLPILINREKQKDLNESDMP